MPKENVKNIQLYKWTLAAWLSLCDIARYCTLLAVLIFFLILKILFLTSIRGDADLLPSPERRHDLVGCGLLVGVGEVQAGGVVGNAEAVVAALPAPLVAKAG